MWFCTVFVERNSWRGDLRGGHGRGQQPQDLQLALGQVETPPLVLAGRVVEPRDAFGEALGDRAAERAAAAGHEVDRAEQLRRLGVLGDVAAGARR